MSYETILVEKQEGLRVITLNRPERLNALSLQLLHELGSAIAEIDADEEARCLVLAGAGRGFCAGADLKELAEGKVKFPRFRPRYTYLQAIEDLGIPTIAAVGGPCNGGGLELALCCDFRIASESASFGLGEVKLGTMPLAGATARLPRLIGMGRAKEFLYFGNRVGGEEAYRIGLVNKVVPQGQEVEEARRWAAELANNAPLSLRMIKAAVQTGMQMGMREALEYEARFGAELVHTQDIVEGGKAFAEKRKPVFQGR